MDKLKQQGKWAKFIKSGFKKSIKTRDGHWKSVGPVHIKDEDYGTTNLGSMFPMTNRYVKKVKRDLKTEYRAVKRGQKHKLKLEIEEMLLEN